METQHKDEMVACCRSKISYDAEEDIIYIEHFSSKGKLLSKVTMDYEDAYDYARMLLEVADHALGVEDA